MAAFAIPSNPAYFPKFSLFFLSVLHPVKENKRIVSMVAASKTPFSAHDLCIPPNKLGAGGSSISPIMIGTKRIVDRNRSPAFQAVENIESRLWASNFRASTSCIPDLESVLTLLFSDRKASPLDEDDSGNTLLFVSLF